MQIKPPLRLSVSRARLTASPSSKQSGNPRLAGITGAPTLLVADGGVFCEVCDKPFLLPLPETSQVVPVPVTEWRPFHPIESYPYQPVGAIQEERPGIRPRIEVKSFVIGDEGAEVGQ